MKSFVTALQGIYIISNAQTYTTQNPIPSGTTTCTSNPCNIVCNGKLSCTSGYEIVGPTNGDLTVTVDSQASGSVVTFSVHIVCSDCSSLTINVIGDAYNQFISNYVLVPSNGPTTLNCAGAEITNGEHACAHVNFAGNGGYGPGNGQVNVVDVSATEGRIDTTSVNYYCVEAGTWYQGESWDPNSEGYQWNSGGYLEAVGEIECQTEVDPGCLYSLTDYLDNCYCTEDSSSTQQIVEEERMIEKGTVSLRGNSVPGFVTISEFDYYFMRACMVVTLLGFCLVIISWIKNMFGSHNKKVYSYSNVKYDTEITDNDN